MLTHMMPLIFQGAFVVGIIIAIVHVLKIRNDGADPTRIDALTRGERFLAIINGLLGGIIPVGLIYYFGLKKRFPTKASQVLKIFFWMIGIAVLVFIAAFAIVEYQLQQARQGLRDAVERAQQQQEQLGDVIPGYSESPTGNTQPDSPTQTNGSQTSPASSGTASVISGAQSVPQDSQGPYGDPRGTITMKGTAAAKAVEVYLQRADYFEQYPKMDYASNEYDTNFGKSGPVAVVNGAWSAKIPGIPKESYVVLVFDSATHKLIVKGSVSVSINKLWGAPSATIDQSSLMSNSSMPTITGTASNTSELNITINEEYQSIPVVNGKWTFVYKGPPLSSGTYPVLVRLQAPPNTVFVQTTIKVVVQ